MESWPLQVALQTPEGEASFVLSERVCIWKGGVAVDPGVLGPGQYIRVRALSESGALEEIEIED